MSVIMRLGKGAAVETLAVEAPASRRGHRRPNHGEIMGTSWEKIWEKIWGKIWEKIWDHHPTFWENVPFFNESSKCH